MMTTYERDTLTRDLQRALKIQTEARKRVSYADEPRLAKRLDTSCTDLAETISMINGPAPKLQIADIMADA